MSYSKNYEEIFFTLLTELHDNIQYCMIIESHGTWNEYKFVNSVNIKAEHFYYDGYYGINFVFYNFHIFLTDESFYFEELKNEQLITDALIDITDFELYIVDKDSYFQYSITNDLYGVRWQAFPLIKNIRDAFFDGYCTHDYLEKGFKFI